MRRAKLGRRILHSFLLTLLLLFFTGCAQVPRTRDTLFQVSTISALLEGDYEGEITFQELKKHGNFGIGTFNNLDGEMVGLRGDFYQVKADGKVYPVKDSMKTPFALVTFFHPDKAFPLNESLNYPELMAFLDGLIPNKNLFYAIKIEGTFRYIKTTSVPAQEKPFPPLTEVVKNQPEFEFRMVRGTLVGFRCPEYAGGINVAGYHFHFLTEDRKAGGHLLECETEMASIQIDSSSSLFLVLPKGTKNILNSPSLPSPKPLPVPSD